MPILNYTTKVDVFQSLGEIQASLVKHGARKILQDFDEKQRVSAISFMIETPAGQKYIRLPANVKAVLKVLKEHGVKCDQDQAERVAWRITKDWVQAQMAILEAEMVSMEEVFFPYLLDGSGEKTLFEAYREKQQHLISGGNA